MCLRCMASPERMLMKIQICDPKHFCYWNGTSILHCHVSASGAYGEPITTKARLLLIQFYDWVRSNDKVIQSNKEKITNIMTYVTNNRVTEDDIEKGLHNFLKEIAEYDLDLWGEDQEEDWGGRKGMSLEIFRNGKFL